MQRYRINYVLFFGLVGVGLFVLGVAYLFIHPWQVNRNAVWFQERATNALAENDLREAFDYQYKYVRYRGDEKDAHIKLAKIGLDLFDQDDATLSERTSAYTVLENTVRDTGDKELRRKLVDMLILFRRPTEALVHLDSLLQDAPDDTELQSMRVRSLYATNDYRKANELALDLIGYDSKTKEFDSENAVAGNQPEIYELLAASIREKDRDEKFARKIIDRMCEANPGSFEAYLSRAAFLYSVDKEAAMASLDKAYEIAPEEESVLERKGTIAVIEEEYDEAAEIFKKSLELHPKSINLYNLLAQTEFRRGNVDEAIKVLDRGLKEFDERKAISLRTWKIEFLFNVQDYEEIEKELALLKDLRIPAYESFIDYHRARMSFQQAKWAAAAAELRRLRPLLFQFPSQQAQAGAMLAASYEKLGKYDLSLETYSLVLQEHPEYSPALAGRQRMLQRIRPEESIEQFDVVLLTQEMLARPKDEQDWSELDNQIREWAEENELPESRQILYRAQVFIERKMFAEAKDLIREAALIDPDDVAVRLAAVKLIQMEPGGGPAKALAQLDRIERTVGVSLQSRALRINLLLAIGGDNVAQKINALAEGIDGLSQSAQAQLLLTIGVGLQKLGHTKEANTYWYKAAALVPNNLPIRMHLFEMALLQNDDAALREAQEKILEIVQDKNDASFILTEVKRLITGYAREEVSREELLEARKLLDAALIQRPKWNELHILYGKLLLVLQEDINLALERLDDALKYGRPNERAVGLQVQLLARQGRYDEARARMKFLREETRGSILGGVESEVLLQTGDPEAAYVAAEKLASLQENVPATQKWFADVAKRSGHLEEATAALRKAVAILPADAELWSQLLILYAQQQKLAEMEDAMRQAQLALDAEWIPLFNAKLYELNRKWQDAERIYLASYVDRSDEPPLARKLAEFYLRWSSAHPANRGKAGIYINRILRLSYEGETKPNDPNVAWARTQAARLLAESRDYQQSKKALQLVEQGAPEGKLSTEDQMLRAEILAVLNDPISLGKAVETLTELRENKQLNKTGTLLLAQLLRKTKNWNQCESIMIDAIGTYGADEQVWTTYIGMLIDRAEYSRADQRLRQLREFSTDNKSYNQLRALLAAKQNDQELVKSSLRALLPKNLKGDLTPGELQLLFSVAQLAIQCEQIELAEKILSAYVQKAPNAAFALTRFRALHGDAELAVSSLKKEFPKRMDEVIVLAAQMLRQRRAEVGDHYDEEINKLLARALRDDPDSAQRQLIHAEILEIEGDSEQSVVAYDKLLKRDDIPERTRAIANNNLAFLLALTNERLDEAEQLVEESMEVLGPISDLLDTRAFVRIASQKYDLAVEDLTLAVSVNQDSIKYYHLARAQLLAGDEESALRSWREAKKLGGVREKLSALEQPTYDEFEAKMEQNPQA